MTSCRPAGRAVDGDEPGRRAAVGIVTRRPGGPGARRRRVPVGLRLLLALVSGILVPVASATPVGADGTESLGPPSLPLQPGTGVVITGTGLFVQPSSFDVSVPADATVVQVLLYWEAGHREGDTSGESSDETIRVNGIEVAGPHVGGPTVFYTEGDGREVITSTHRADITGLGLVGPGTTTLTIDGLDTDEIDDGAGVVVIYLQEDDRGVPIVNPIQLRDGNDIAFIRFPPPRDTTVPQTFAFEPADEPRVARLGLIATSTHRSGNIGPPRPNELVYTVGGETIRISDPFPDIQGDEFDSVVLDVVIPPGATELTAQLLSVEDGVHIPASLVWMVGTLVVPAQAEGSLTVTKEVSAGADPGQTFDVTVDCSDDAFDQQLTLTGGGSQTIDAIPLGTTCTVSEIPPPGWQPPTFTPSDTVTITEGAADVTVVVTNAFAGSLTLRKEVTGVGDLQVTKLIDAADLPGYVPGSTFGFVVDCSDDRFDQGFRLANEQTRTITAIPTGTSCTVTETEKPDPEPGFGSWSQPVYSPGQTVQIAAPADQGFDIALDCSADAFDEQLTLAGGESRTIDAIPLGATCTVSETPPAGWQPPTFTPSETVTVTEDTPTVVIDNRALVPPTRLTVTNSVASEATPLIIPATGAVASERGLLSGLALLVAGTFLVVLVRFRRRLKPDTNLD